MKFTKSCIFFCLAGLPLLTNCSTIVAGRNQEVTFDSEPKGAKVVIAGKTYGETPLTVNIERKKGQVVTFEKEGHHSQTRGLETSINTWFLGNIILGGFIGSTTDAITGSMHEYKPNSYYITLVPKKDGPSQVLNSERAKLKDFIVSNHKELVNDLSRGGGRQFDALAIMLKVKTSDQSAVLKKMSALSQVYEEPPQFAEEVVRLYGNPQ
jgi:hypothetical protein